MNCFSSGKPFLNLFNRGSHENGLYSNQIGAIGAAVSHFSVKTEPALISMPTGTGKTAVMILLSYVLEGSKILVITPSQIVRKQIAEQFRDAKLLVRKNIFKPEYLPKVYALSSEETSKEAWDKILLENDVVVAIPGTLNKILELENVIAAETFDIVFVDEAHHSRAQSWTNILGYFGKARQILLTATPFRRDKKELKARMIYHYPLKTAYENKLFSQIKFVPVKRSDSMTDEEINIEIAKQTEIQFKNRSYVGHKIIIRTDGKTKADELSHIYKAHTKLNLAVIHSRLTEKSIDQRITDLREGKIDGIICVDMMGEGYDFPALKYAAIHVPHKSLAITLQMVGRISRTNVPEGNIATVIASEHDFEIESTCLYRENTDWSLILPDLHELKTGLTQDEQDFADSFTSAVTEAEEVNTDTAPLKLQITDFLPFLHVKLYRIFLKKRRNENIGTDPTPPLIDIFKPVDFSSVSVLENSLDRYHNISEDSNVAIYVVAQRKRPRWLINNPTVNDIQNELIIWYYEKKSSILFICSTVKEIELYEHIVQSLLEPAANHDMIHIPHLKRIMAGWQNERFYNVGMKNRKTRGSYEAYKQLLGSKVEGSILPSDKFSYTRGHSFGEAYDTVLKKQMLLGISTSSKVWTLDEKKIIYLVQWCMDLSKKVGDPSMDKLPGPLSDLDTGTIVEIFPDKPIFFADWDYGVYTKNSFVDFLDQHGVITEIEGTLLCSCNIIIDTVSDNEIIFKIHRAELFAKIRFTIDPVASYQYDDDSPYKIIFRRGFQHLRPEDTLALLLESPVHLFYEDLSHLSGKVYFESRVGDQLFPLDSFTKTAWPTNVNVRKEFLTPTELADKVAGKNIKMSIHDYIIELAKDEFDVVYYDHGSLEIADIIGLKKGLIRFYHCKKQDSDNPRCSVDDMYEVIGQALKSVNWSNRKILYEKMVKRATNNDIGSKLKKGTLQNIKDVLDSFSSPSLPIEITIVQPGLKSDGHDTNQAAAFSRIVTLLAGADEYMHAISACQLKIICS